MSKPATARARLESYLETLERGAVFSRRDVQGLAPAGSIGSALARMVGEGRLERLGPGLFHLPRVNPRLQRAVPPDIHDVAQALARKFGWTLVPSGQWAANRLGLSTQVPAQAEYLSNGPDRTETVGRRRLRIRHARPKDLLADDPEVSLVIQALRHLGRDAVDAPVLDKLRKTLPNGVRERLFERTRSTSHWLHEVASQLVDEREVGHG